MKKKLQNLLAQWPTGTIATTKWLSTLGISRILTHEYKKKGWMKAFAQGAFYKPQDKIEWYGALYALQYQLGIDVYVGAKTALELSGLAHYIPMGRSKIDIFKLPHETVPRWFINHEWDENVRVIECSILPPQMGIEDITVEGINIKISTRERATIELLYLTPRLYSFDEVPLLMNSLGSLRGNALNGLLINCTSEKVKRLMLYFGEKQKHAWYKDIDQKKLVCGKTTLKIAPRDGKYISKYAISIPKEYVIDDDQEIKF